MLRLSGLNNEQMKQLPKTQLPVSKTTWIA